MGSAKQKLALLTPGRLLAKAMSKLDGAANDLSLAALQLEEASELRIELEEVIEDVLDTKENLRTTAREILEAHHV